MSERSRPLPADLAEWGKNPAVLRFVHVVLDKRDRRGYFPRTITYRRTEKELRALDRFLPPLALKSKSDDRVVVHLGRVQDVLASDARDHGRDAWDLEELFDRLAGREPRNMRFEADAFRSRFEARVEEGIAEGERRARAAGAKASSAAFERCLRRLRDAASQERAAFRRLAREASLPHVEEAVARLVAALAVVLAQRSEVLRLDVLSVLVAGSTKALRPDTQDYARLVQALGNEEPELLARLGRQARESPQVTRRFLLEHFGIVPNDVPLDVLVRGPLTLDCDGEELGDVARLARRGLSAKLTYSVLTACSPRVPPGTRVVTVENETAFHMIAQRHPEDLVVFTSGQPSWPVILLLRKLAAGDPRLEVRHFGDLDRSGLLILRSLRQKTELDIRPLWMDRETYEQCADLSIRLRPDELTALRSLAKSWDEPYGHDIIAALIVNERWIEQEAILRRLGELEAGGGDR